MSEVFTNDAYEAIFRALQCIQSQSDAFANSVYTAALGTNTDVTLIGKGAIVNGVRTDITVDISTAAGAMAVSLWLEEQANKVQSASEIAAEQKKEASKVNQTIG